jgi:hypothetical protein
VALVKVLTSHQRWFARESLDIPLRAYPILRTLLQDDEVQQFLRVNRYQNVLWFNKEAFEQLSWWLLLVAIAATPLRSEAEARDDILAAYKVVRQLLRAEEESGYRVEELLKLTASYTA